MMPKVFISYSSTDKPFARRLEKSLRLAGIDVWLDEKKLFVGDSIIKELGKAIQGTDFVIAVLSQASIRSTWVEKELALAMTREQEEKVKVVLPIKIDACDVPPFLKDKLCADFSDASNFTDSLEPLLAVLSTDLDVCDDCRNEVPLSLDSCLHCGRPSAPPNVRSARSREERESLKERYNSAKELASRAKCDELLKSFESALEESKVVIQCNLRTLERLVHSSMALLGNYYDSIEMFKTGDSWSRLRNLADEYLFPGYKSRIRFGVLSLDDGLHKYGECSLILRDSMIEGRTSFFQENSAFFTSEHRYDLGPGYRSTWQDRGKLCIAKLAATLISERPSPQKFAGVLLRASDHGDEFVEAHIWGNISIRTVECVRVTKRGSKLDKSLRSLEQKLASFSVNLEVG